MNFRPSIAFIAMSLAACQAPPPPLAATPAPFVLIASAPPAPLPLPLPVGLLQPGASRDFTAAAAAHVPLLLGNPSNDAAAVRLEVTPAGEGPGATPAPTPTPAPESTSMPPEVQAPPIAPFPASSSDPRDPR